MASMSAFNRWLEDYWGFDHQGRILAAPMLSLADPEAAAAEVDSLPDRGARIIHIRPAPVPGPNGTSRPPGAKLHDPGWARTASGAVPVALHLADSAPVTRFDSPSGGRSDSATGTTAPPGPRPPDGTTGH